MDEFTIHCTEEQTRKALSLGASIKKAETHHDLYNNKYCFVDDIEPAIIIPTAEQMIGWLETQEILVDVEKRTGIVYVYDRKNKTHIETITIHIRKEATLTAIDAALDYLIIMNNYSIYCTQEQTRRAIELGAPIEIHDTFDSYDIKESNIFYKDKFIELADGRLIERITAEQMRGWLRSKGFRFKIEELSDTITAYRTTFGYWYKCGQSSNPKGATLAAIDAALKYLSNKK